MSCLQMYSGLIVDFDDPQPETIDLGDISKALARICRYGGRTTVPHSVAAHAMLVSDIVMERTGDSELAFAALHHDDHEAYIGDIVTPLKEQLEGAASALASRLDNAIASCLGIRPELLEHPAVREADFEALWLERDELLPNATEDVWGPHPTIETSQVVRLEQQYGRSESLFLSYHHRLRGARVRPIHS